MNGNSLKSQLEERKTNFSAQADERIKKIYEEGIGAVRESGIVERALNVGDRAPDFVLSNPLGRSVKLYDCLKEGPVLLTWYRGSWCPYCNLTLKALQEELPRFKAIGARLLALTPELPDRSLSLQEKGQLEFEVLSDRDNRVARKYGLVFELTREVAEIYGDKFKLKEHNGDEGNELPLAATYIIDRDGNIRYAFLDGDYRNRAEPSELTKLLGQL
ncbi:MAG: peroxiredoxin-like family protein [Spirochaetales bacterium]|nr:peroxiredoxin-like family protein [Spirochaetales bacterium]